MGKILIKRLPPLPTIKDVVKAYNLRAVKKLSQNFLLDMNVAHRIVSKAGSIADGEVCEVGPGPGSLTRAILERQVARLSLIEKDRRFLPILDELASAVEGDVDIIHGDVLNFNMAHAFSGTVTTDWSDPQPPNLHLIGNLPFSVATPLLFRLLQQIYHREGLFKYGRTQMTLTFQEEFAERMVAHPEYHQRCRVSVMTQNWTDVKHCFTIPNQVFIPSPQVRVGVVRLVPRITPIIALPYSVIEKFVRVFFHGRQKHCVKCLSNLFPSEYQSAFTQEMLDQTGIRGELRPMDVTNSQIRDLCFIYFDLCQRNPGLINYSHREPKSLELLAAGPNHVPEPYKWTVSPSIDACDQISSSSIG